MYSPRWLDIPIVHLGEESVTDTLRNELDCTAHGIKVHQSQQTLQCTGNSKFSQMTEDILDEGKDRMNKLEHRGVKANNKNSIHKYPPRYNYAIVCNIYLCLDTVLKNW